MNSSLEGVLADWLIDESSFVVYLEEEFVALVQIQASACIFGTIL
jgi:hypothetical protein